MRSASFRVFRPSKRTIGTSAAPRTEATTSSPIPSQRRREPLLNRSAMSVRGCTFTSPPTPCGAPTTPTIGSSLLLPPAAVPTALVRPRPEAAAARPRLSVDFEVDLCSIARRHHFEERADGFRDPSPATDYLSDVRFSDLQMELGEVAVQLLGDNDRRGIVDQRLSDVLQEDPHATGRRRLTHRTFSISRLRRGDVPAAAPIRLSRRSRSSLTVLLPGPRPRGCRFG